MGVVLARLDGRVVQLDWLGLAWRRGRARGLDRRVAWAGADWMSGDCAGSNWSPWFLGKGGARMMEPAFLTLE